jgi:hypothetical protein
MRDRWTPDHGQVEQRLGHEVAVADGVEASCRTRGEAEVGGHRRGVERERRAGEGAGPSGDTSSRRVEQAVDVAGSAHAWASRWWASSTGWARCRCV